MVFEDHLLLTLSDLLEFETVLVEDFFFLWSGRLGSVVEGEEGVFECLSGGESFDWVFGEHFSEEVHSWGVLGKSLYLEVNVTFFVLLEDFLERSSIEWRFLGQKNVENNSS